MNENIERQGEKGDSGEPTDAERLGELLVVKPGDALIFFNAFASVGVNREKIDEALEVFKRLQKGETVEA